MARTVITIIADNAAYNMPKELQEALQAKRIAYNVYVTERKEQDVIGLMMSYNYSMYEFFTSKMNVDFWQFYKEQQYI